MIREGNKITFDDGYSFYETLHGPVVATVCEWCGITTYHAEYRDRGLRLDPAETLCQQCSRRKYGLSAVVNVKRGKI